MTVKRAYLARRNSALPAEQFVARWRQHMQLGLQFPELPQRYRQIRYCRVLHEADGIGGRNPGHDGVGFLVLRDATQLSAPYRDAAIGPTMRADELRVFSAHVADAALAAEEIVLRPGGGPVGVLQFLKRRAGTTAQAFRKDWRERHAPLVVAQASGLARLYAERRSGGCDDRLRRPVGDVVFRHRTGPGRAPRSGDRRRPGAFHRAG